MTGGGWVGGLSPSARPAAGVEPAEPLADAGRRFYYPELDGLRFVAFGLVYLFHNGLPQFEGWVARLVRNLPDPIQARWAVPADLGFRFQSNGWVGVQIFFVLSGFLIATLLLREEERFGRIDSRAFWMRRILRIWPLYYLTFLIAAVLLPGMSGQFGTPFYNDFLSQQFAPFLAFLGNWSLGVSGPPPNDAVTVLWSVCVEEQFYLLCPLLLLLTPRRLRLEGVILLIAGSIALRWWLAGLKLNPLLFQFNLATHADSLLAGVGLALLRQRFPAWKLVPERFAGLAQLAVAVGFLALLLVPDLAREERASLTWHYVAIWLLTLALIALLLEGRGWLARALAYRGMVWLGMISYGLYMFHEIAIWFVSRSFLAMGWFPNKEILQTIATFALTVGLSAVSYYGFERLFLKRKSGWTRVPSRPV